MKQINITKGNDFAIYVPVVLLTSTGAGAPDMALFTAGEDFDLTINTTAQVR